MEEQDMPLRTIHHLEATRHVPNASRLTARSTYELIREAAVQDPEQAAVTFLSGGDHLDRLKGMSYGALLNGLHQTANLLADLGVGSQGVIALLLPDLPETHLLFWGGQAAGIVCPIPPSLPTPQVVDLLQAAKAKILVALSPSVSQDLGQKAEQVRRQVESIALVLQVRGPGNERDAAYAFNALLADYPSDCLHTGREIAPDDIAVYLPTGTTTATPSLIPLTHGNLLYTAWALGLVTTLAPENFLLRGLSRFFQGCY